MILFWSKHVSISSHFTVGGGGGVAWLAAICLQAFFLHTWKDNVVHYEGIKFNLDYG
jgi:hypothetical protein